MVVHRVVEWMVLKLLRAHEVELLDTVLVVLDDLVLNEGLLQQRMHLVKAWHA